MLFPVLDLPLLRLLRRRDPAGVAGGDPAGVAGGERSGAAAAAAAFFLLLFLDFFHL